MTASYRDSIRERARDYRVTTQIISAELGTCSRIDEKHIIRKVIRDQKLITVLSGYNGQACGVWYCLVRSERIRLNGAHLAGSDRLRTYLDESFPLYTSVLKGVHSNAIPRTA